MSDGDSKPPEALPGAPRPGEAVPAAGVGSATEAAQNDELPGPALPPRDYDPNARLQFTPAVAPIRLIKRDRTLVRFFRFLAALLFWGGSATGLAVVLYRNVVLPRLAILSSRLGSLHMHHLKHYTQFLERIRKVAISNDLLCPRTSALAAAIQTPLPVDNVKDEAVQTTSEALDMPAETSRPPSRISETTSEKAVGPGPEAVVPPKAEQNVNLSAPLLASLSALRSEVAVTTRSDEDEGVSPPKKLVDSLELLSSYMSTQTFHATQTKLNLGGGGYSFGQVPGPNGTNFQPSPAGEAAAQCRTEIRGLKGLLLNRRNFALLERWDDEPADGEATV